MSIAIMSAIWRTDLPTIDKFVAMKLADCASDDGRNIYPGVRAVARACSVSERRVQTALRNLEVAGLLVREREADARAHLPAVYRIDLTRLPPGERRSPGEPRAPGGGEPRSPAPVNDVHPNHHNKPSTHKRSVRRTSPQPHEAFEIFWREFPSRSPHSSPKQPAQQKFSEAIKAGTDPEAIIEGARKYAAAVAAARTEERYIAQAVTWLHQRRWGDDYAAPAQPRPSSRSREGAI